MISLAANRIRCCDGPTRREFLSAGSLGALGFTLPQLLGAREAAAAPVLGARSFGAAKRCIILFMWGGPPQQDTFDLKPDAPSDIRGELKPIATNVPGVQISELLSGLAKHADKYSIIRSVTHEDMFHTTSVHAMLTGNVHARPNTADQNPTPQDFPHFGSALSKLRPATNGLPAFVSLPYRIHTTGGIVAPGLDGGFLGKKSDPFLIDRDPNAANFEVPDLAPRAEVPTGRIERRRDLLSAVNDRFAAIERSGAPGVLDTSFQKAFNLISAPAARAAFDLRQEPDKVRDRYGRHIFGQGVLMARRLVESGVPLATVYWQMDGGAEDPAWDTHINNYPGLRDRLCPPLDRAMSALLADLHDRGMLEDTLVVWMGEFGRTPKINARGGRDHWPGCASVVMAGGGVKGGTVYGKSDATAAYPDADPVSPAELGATIYHCLGVNPETEVMDPQNRPQPLVRAEPVRGVLV